MNQEKNLNTETEHIEEDFQEVKLTDCDVPINCPFGLNLHKAPVLFITVSNSNGYKDYSLESE